MFVILLAGPATVSITDQQGNKVGYYETDPTGMKIAVVPNPGQGTYQVRVDGTGPGEYHLAFIYGAEEKSCSADGEGRTTLGSRDSYIIIYNPGAPEPIQFKHNKIYLPLIFRNYSK